MFKWNDSKVDKVVKAQSDSYSSIVHNSQRLTTINKDDVIKKLNDYGSDKSNLNLSLGVEQGHKIEISPFSLPSDTPTICYLITGPNVECRLKLDRVDEGNFFVVTSPFMTASQMTGLLDYYAENKGSSFVLKHENIDLVITKSTSIVLPPNCILLLTLSGVGGCSLKLELDATTPLPESSSDVQVMNSQSKNVNEIQNTNAKQRYFEKLLKWLSC